MIEENEEKDRNQNLKTKARQPEIELKRKYLLSFLKEQIQFLRDCGKFGTATNYERTCNILTLFLKGNDLPLVSLNEEVIEDFKEFLLKRGLKRNSISFYMRILRAIYNKAARHGLVRQNSIFNNVYTGVDVTRKRAVSEDIIHRMLSLDLRTHKNLNFARDLFLFSFFTRGMAFVDMVYLKNSDIKSDILTYTRHKTGKNLVIKIEPCIRTLIDKYQNQRGNLPYLFPLLKTENPQKSYNQYKSALRVYNNRLKKISELMHLSNYISSYTSRHTWATIARDHNVPISIISAAMGHSSERTTQIYLATLDNSLIDNANSQLLAFYNQSLSC